MIALLMPFQQNYFEHLDAFEHILTPNVLKCVQRHSSVQKVWLQIRGHLEILCMKFGIHT